MQATLQRLPRMSCGKFRKDTLIKDIKESKFFSFLADEASGCSNQVQLSFVLRFVDKDGQIREELLGFLHFELGLSGKPLDETILTEFGNLTLDINNCRGQGYDGAASVFCHINGLSAHILRINEKSVYTHCHSHQLNLVVTASYSIQYVRNVLDQIKELLKMQDFSTENHASDFLKKKLKNLCRTRWIEQITRLDNFEDLYISNVFSLDSMSVNEGRVYNRETSAKASSFYKLIVSFNFIIATLALTRSFLI